MPSVSGSPLVKGLHIRGLHVRGLHVRDIQNPHKKFFSNWVIVGIFGHLSCYYIIINMRPDPRILRFYFLYPFSGKMTI